MHREEGPGLHRQCGDSLLSEDEAVEETGFQPFPLRTPDFYLHWDLAGPQAEHRKMRVLTAPLIKRLPDLRGLGEITVVSRALEYLPILNPPCGNRGEQLKRCF